MLEETKKKLDQFFPKVCEMIIKQNWEAILPLSSHRDRVSFLLKKLSSLNIEITSEERKQFIMFNLQLVLSWNGLEAKLKKVFYIFGLKNKISILDIQEYIEYLYTLYPTSFQEIIEQQFFYPLLAKAFHEENDQQIIYSEINKDLPKSLIFQWSTLYELDENLFMVINKELQSKSFQNSNISNDFLLLFYFAKQHSLITDLIVMKNELQKQRFKIDVKITKLFNIIPMHLNRLFMYASLQDSSSYEKWFSAVHYESFKLNTNQKDNSWLDFDYWETKEEKQLDDTFNELLWEQKSSWNKTQKEDNNDTIYESYYYFDFFQKDLIHLESFFLKFNYSLHKLLVKFETQIKNWDVFIYEEKIYQQIITMVSRWIKYALLLLHATKKDIYDFEEVNMTYNLLLFFLEYHKIYSCEQGTTFYNNPQMERKLGLLSFHTPITQDLLFETLLKTSIRKEDLISLDKLFQTELFFEIYGYNNNNDGISLLIDPLKQSQWWALLAFKFLLKKIELLQPFKYWENNKQITTVKNIVENNEKTKSFYFSNDFNYYFSYTPNAKVKSIIHIKNRPDFSWYLQKWHEERLDIENNVSMGKNKDSGIEQQLENKKHHQSLFWKIANIFNKKENQEEYKTIQEDKYEIKANEINPIEWNKVLLKNIFQHYPKKYAKYIVMQSPYMFLKNYKNPLWVLDDLFNFQTQSFYQILKINQTLNSLQAFYWIVFNTKLKNFVIKNKWFNYPFPADKTSANKHYLQKFNNQLPLITIGFQSWIWTLLPLMPFKKYQIKKTSSIDIEFEAIDT